MCVCVFTDLSQVGHARNPLFLASRSAQKRWQPQGQQRAACCPTINVLISFVFFAQKRSPVVWPTFFVFQTPFCDGTQIKTIAASRSLSIVIDFYADTPRFFGGIRLIDSSPGCFVRKRKIGFLLLQPRVVIVIVCCVGYCFIVQFFTPNIIERCPAAASSSMKIVSINLAKKNGNVYNETQCIVLKTKHRQWKSN